MSEDQTPKEAYLEGRLLGLNRLITILKQSMKEDQTTNIDQILVEHIAGEMNTILNEMEEHHGGDHPVIVEAKKRIEELPPLPKEEPAAQPKESTEAGVAPQTPSELKKSVEGADELMQSLMALKQKQSEGEKEGD